MNRSAVFLTAILAAWGCREDVNFAVDDAAAVDGAALNTSQDAFADTADGRPIGPLHHDGAAICAQCNSDGTTCRVASDCCSQRCEGGFCLPSGTCQAPGDACATRNQCCSGRCEPVGPSGALVCTAYCVPNGTLCTSAGACCSLACNAGMCGGPICSPAGALCRFDSDCCGDKCSSGRCSEALGSCFPSGEACGNEAGVNCCSGVCNEATGRCDFGFGQCRPKSSPCTGETRGECCLGACMFDPNEGVPICTAACLGNDRNCNRDSDCCDGVCSGIPSHCAAPNTFCAP